MADIMGVIKHYLDHETHRLPQRAETGAIRTATAGYSAALAVVERMRVTNRNNTFRAAFPTIAKKQDVALAAFDAAVKEVHRNGE